MKLPRALTAATALAVSAAAPGAEVPAGKAADWCGGTANIMIYGHDAPIGRIHQDGAVTFDLPTPPQTGQTVAETFDRCRTGSLELVNGDADVAPIMIYAEIGGDEVGMVAADSAEMAAYQLSWGQTELVKGSFLRWLHVDGAASVTGKCVENLLTVSGPADLVNESELRFEPGWNLVRTTHVEIMPHADGSAHVIHAVDDALQALPTEATWYLQKK
jgi:hypothetical protein